MLRRDLGTEDDIVAQVLGQPVRLIGVVVDVAESNDLLIELDEDLGGPGASALSGVAKGA